VTQKSAARASPAARRHLNDIFAELCRIESPSGSEHACAQRVRAELSALGVDIHEDDSRSQTGSDSGNLLARIPAQGEAAAPPILLCAHLDTVPLAAPVEPVLRDDGWENAAEGILGADNKAAIAVILELARDALEHGPAIDLELLFTVGEERALAGANAFDSSALRSGYGYVFDHASPIGEIVLSSPCHFRLDAHFRGAAAHAGIRPEDGRSAILAAAHAITAMPHGRVDEQTTVNVGTISGGSAINVVPEHCTLLAEVRGRSEERAQSTLERVVQAINEAANLTGCDCDVDITIKRTFSAYEMSPKNQAVMLAERALSSCGYQPIGIASGGASDANALIAKGIHVINLANGTERNHEPSERVSVNALEGMLDVALELLDLAANAAPPSAR
jgi:tripeptide aminopeptidase